MMSMLFFLWRSETPVDEELVASLHKRSSQVLSLNVPLYGAFFLGGIYREDSQEKKECWIVSYKESFCHC